MGAALSYPGKPPTVRSSLRRGHLSLTVTFQPVRRGACTGRLLVEIDSAGGRFTEVVLKGRGI